MNKFTGLLVSGAALKLYALGAAAYTASYVWTVLAPTMEAISKGFAGL